MWDLWWTKWHWSRFYNSTSVSPTNSHSTDCFILIRGWYNRPISGRRIQWTQSHPAPRLRGKSQVGYLVRDISCYWLALIILRAVVKFLIYVVVMFHLADHSGHAVLRHEPSSPAQTLVSWVRIPLKAWMSICVYFVSVSVAALLRADPPSKVFYRLCKKTRN
jgi:hypothetical protein